MRVYHADGAYVGAMPQQLLHFQLLQVDDIAGSSPTTHDQFVAIHEFSCKAVHSVIVTSSGMLLNEEVVSILASI